MPINELRAIATFAKAVELGSIRSAAAAQGVTPQAASKVLAELVLAPTLICISPPGFPRNALPASARLR
jgi:hypothetical protein